MHRPAPSEEFAKVLWEKKMSKVGPPTKRHTTPLHQSKSLFTACVALHTPRFVIFSPPLFSPLTSASRKEREFKRHAK
ncbi:hypothetical protein EYC84_005539 [Monilinia fructicola]|uniref:Uncharacterized protein n=1 Tax=Monilinia fructicola TaxID=38448 RepID=A0A5M9K1Y5_MONFR|nr:hypothetical protein EYC84_005539 [Monilinia fructicola]